MWGHLLIISFPHLLRVVSIQWGHVWCRTDTRQNFHAAATTHRIGSRAGDVVTCPSIEITGHFWSRCEHREEATGLIQYTVCKNQGTVSYLSLSDTEDRQTQTPTLCTSNTHTHCNSDYSWRRVWENSCKDECSICGNFYYSSLASPLKQTATSPELD